MTTATPSEYQRSIDRARKAGGARLVLDEPIPGREYVVASLTEPLVRYTVVIESPDDWRCGCTAGLWGKGSCSHRAAVFLRRLGQKAASSDGRSLVGVAR